MKTEIRAILVACAILGATFCAASVFAQDQVKIANGLLEGASEKNSGVRSFKGIPLSGFKRNRSDGRRAGVGE